MPDSLPAPPEFVASLDSLCSVVIALNLTYLALRRFRHLLEISEEASKQRALLIQPDLTGLFSPRSRKT